MTFFEKLKLRTEFALKGQSELAELNIEHRGQSERDAANTKKAREALGLPKPSIIPQDNPYRARSATQRLEQKYSIREDYQGSDESFITRLVQTQKEKASKARSELAAIERLPMHSDEDIAFLKKRIQEYDLFNARLEARLKQIADIRSVNEQIAKMNKSENTLTSKPKADPTPPA